MENKVRQFGFVPPFIKPDEYVKLGGITKLPDEVLVLDGNWKPWRTKGEIQRNEFFDSYNCTAYGTAKIIRTYMRRKFNVDFNPSERWIGIIAGTQPPGNDPNTVMEAIRKNGLIPEAMLPFDDLITSVEDYFSFQRANENECREEGNRWLMQYDFKHEWLFYPTASIEAKMAMLKKYLVASPLGVSVMAWKERGGRYYKEIGEQDTHWTMAEAGAWRIFDSYPEFEKLLEERYDFGFCKRIYIEKKEQKKEARKTLCDIIKESAPPFLRRFLGTTRGAESQNAEAKTMSGYK